jgi:hypothetical protein
MKRLIPRLNLLALTFAALLLASGSALAAPAPTDPCTLLSQQDAAALLGAPVDPGRSMVTTCAFFGAHGDDQKGVSVLLFDSAGTPPNILASMYNAMLQPQPGRTISPFGGLGEKAHMIADNDQLTLLVQSHGKLVSITAFASHNPHLKDALVQAMRQILQRV